MSAPKAAKRYGKECAVCGIDLPARRRRYCAEHEPKANPEFAVFYKHSAATYIQRLQTAIAKGEEIASNLAGIRS